MLRNSPSKGKKKQRVSRWETSARNPSPGHLLNRPAEKDPDPDRRLRRAGLWAGLVAAGVRIFATVFGHH